MSFRKISVYSVWSVGKLQDVMKQRVTGIGGIFFKAQDAPKLRAWYKKHLRLPLDPTWGGWAFFWRDAKNPSSESSAGSWIPRGNASNCGSRRNRNADVFESKKISRGT